MIYALEFTLKCKILLIIMKNNFPKINLPVIYFGISIHFLQYLFFKINFAH